MLLRLVAELFGLLLWTAQTLPEQHRKGTWFI